MEALLGFAVFAACALAAFKFATNVPGGQLVEKAVSHGLAGLAALVGGRDRSKGAAFMGWLESWKLANHSNRGLVLDGDRRRLGEQDSFSHLVLIAPSGMGKTTRYVIPNVLQLDGCSMLVTDPSGSIWKATSGALAAKGFDVKVLDLSDPTRSNRYNPLAMVKDPLGSMELAKTIVASSGIGGGDAGFWNSGAEQMIDALVQTLAGPRYAGARHEHANLHNVLHLLRESARDPSAVARFVMENGPDTAWSMWSSVTSAEDRVLSNFRANALNALQMLGVPDLARVLSGHDFDFRDFRCRKTVLYVRVPEEKIPQYAFAINMLYAQAFAAWKEREPGPGDLPVYVMADEFGHANIPNFESVSTTIRRFRVSLSIVLQSKAQLELRYGKAGAETILGGGMGSRLVMPGGDMETYEWCAAMAGRRVKETAAGGFENLINPDRIRTMPEDQALFLSKNREALVLSTTPYFKNRRLARLASMAPFDPVSGRTDGHLAYVRVSD